MMSEEVGVAKGTVCLHFDSKEQLLSGLGTRYAEEFIWRSGNLLEASGGLLDRLDEFLELTADQLSLADALLLALPLLLAQDVFLDLAGRGLG